MLNYLSIFKIRLNTLKYRLLIKLRYSNFDIGKNSMIFGKLLLSIERESKVILGDNIVFRSSTKYNFVGIYKPVSISVGKNAKLIVGNNTGFSGTSIYASRSVIIGENCNFGGNTSVWDTDFHPLDFHERRENNISKIRSADIIIGNDVFIGANSIILKGVSIGDRVIIGAGSVVSKNIPMDEIWAGNPARFIRKIK